MVKLSMRLAHARETLISGRQEIVCSYSTLATSNANIMLLKDGVEIYTLALAVMRSLFGRFVHTSFLLMSVPDEMLT